jgi:hypothetical protein
MGNSENSAKRTQVNFVASENQKEQWEEYADEAGFRSFSEFLRTCIQKEVQGDSSSREPSENVTEKLSEVLEGIDRMEGRIHDLDNRVGTIEREVREDPDLKKFASEVFSVLPERDELISYEKKVQQAGTYPDRTIPVSHSGKPEHIAQELDESEPRVEQALDKLREDMNQVQTLVLNEEIEGWAQHYEDGDETRFYKEA